MPKKKITKKENISSQKKQKKDNQLYWVFGAMAGLIILFLLAYSFFQSLNKFEYKGMSFTKTKFGEIPMYYYYFFTNTPTTTGKVISEPKMINLYLRNDPRENNIPIDGEIELLQGKFIYVGINATELKQCGYTSVALANFKSFFMANGFTVKGGVPDETEAERDNLEYVTCEKYPNNPVIIIQSGDETKIQRKKSGIKNIIRSESGIREEIEKTNCYIMTVNNCEILQATEKFTVQSILDAKARQVL